MPDKELTGAETDALYDQVRLSDRPVTASLVVGAVAGLAIGGYFGYVMEQHNNADDAARADRLTGCLVYVAEQPVDAVVQVASLPDDVRSKCGLTAKIDAAIASYDRARDLRSSGVKDGLDSDVLFPPAEAMTVRLPSQASLDNTVQALRDSSQDIGPASPGLFGIAGTFFGTVAALFSLVGITEHRFRRLRKEYLQQK